MADPVSPSPAAERPTEPWGSWSTLFASASDAIFLLSRRRQLRYANRAWEALTGKSFEAMRGSFCLPLKKKGTGPVRALLQALAPPPEVMDGQPATVRRPAPPHRLGPPWWDILFLPVRDESGLRGIVGHIRAAAAPSVSVPSAVLTESLIALRQRAANRATFQLLTSDVPVMQRVEAQARVAARSRMPVWIMGETGTGKETLARIIHFNGVTRDQTFLAIDCAGLQPFLIRNMLFGLAGQAGTHLGTIYLKSPELLPRDLQGELLDWFAEQEDPPRVVVGDSRPPKPDPRDTRLVDEFLTTFGVFEIRLPPLAERARDLPRLVNELQRRAGGADPDVPISHDAVDRLGRHNWPGNLRELIEVIREALKNSNGSRMEVAHLPLYLRTGVAAAHRKPMPGLDDVLQIVETRLIRQALARAKGNKSEAADLLGVPRARLLRRIEALKIAESDAGPSS